VAYCSGPLDRGSEETEIYEVTACLGYFMAYIYKNLRR